MQFKKALKNMMQLVTTKVETNHSALTGLFSTTWLAGQGSAELYAVPRDDALVSVCMWWPLAAMVGEFKWDSDEKEAPQEKEKNVIRTKKRLFLR